MKKTPIKRQSAKGKIEAQKRKEVYRYLIEHSDGKCANCKRPLNWHWLGFEMVHEIPLSRGGKTDIENCQLWCWPCHYGPKGHKTLTEKTYKELTEAYDKLLSLST